MRFNYRFEHYNGPHLEDMLNEWGELGWEVIWFEIDAGSYHFLMKKEK